MISRAEADALFDQVDRDANGVLDFLEVKVGLVVTFEEQITASSIIIVQSRNHHRNYCFPDHQRNAKALKLVGMEMTVQSAPKSSVAI